jgi:ABC-type phosphate transport system substrate-binding protein
MKSVVIIFAIALSLISCEKGTPEISFTHGTADIGCSDAAYDIGAYVANEYTRLHAEAFVSVYRASTVALFDSLLSGARSEAFLDHALSSAESSAFQAAGLNLYTYPVAHFPVYLLVHQNAGVSELDSAGLLRILDGRSNNWKEFGGGDIPIRPYLPQPGEGAWQALTKYFGEFDSVAAVICSSSTQMLELAGNDEGALLVYSKKAADAQGFKKLYWKNAEATVAANPKTILEDPRWPFMITLTYVTTKMKSDVAAGYLTFSVSNDGQKMVMKEGYRPASVPVRVIQMKAPPENESAPG